MSAVAQIVEVGNLLLPFDITPHCAAQKTIAENLIAVFSKSYCPFCTRTKNLIASLPVKKDDVAILELDERSDGTEIQSYLLEKTKQKSVPNVFVKQQHIGGESIRFNDLSVNTPLAGNDDFQAAHSAGKIEKLLSSN
ncbi:hypothetical protein E3P99_00877 [Wallemia hederae]|uniref:Glutaredoxin domain-containing protein n=1 Tax=Wallemia hederae TaxID=1540922 RepID=A0A4T0FTU1_9BASI|nr:hypothetical protein E3P99_00877 [Wallemia hederae]